MPIEEVAEMFNKGEIYFNYEELLNTPDELIDLLHNAMKSQYPMRRYLAETKDRLHKGYIGISRKLIATYNDDTHFKTGATLFPIEQLNKSFSAAPITIEDFENLLSAFKA